MTTTLRFVDTPATFDEVDSYIVVGTKARLASDDVLACLPRAVLPLWPAMLTQLTTGDGGASTMTWVPGDQPKRLTIVALSSRASRHNSPGRPDLIASAIAGRATAGTTGVLIALTAAEHAFAAACAVARALPTLSMRQPRAEPSPDRAVVLGFLAPDGAVPGATLARSAVAAEHIRLAAELVDAPPSVLHTDAFVARAKAVAAQTEGLNCEVLGAEALADRGFGGLIGVGQAAAHPPALVILTWDPPGADQTLVWVGKGIVYDTGGLSLKTKTGMPGMKTDMGGAAAVLGAISAAAQLGYPQRIVGLLCLAENSVGPTATRPDDVLTMYSGKRVEVNNTDAEGRLVLADGVAYAARHLEPDVIVDLATLTGAQLVATGKRHAAIVCNDEELEARAIVAGRQCGDLVHPLPYAPEFFRGEFKSKIADLKNSVKDRGNAQSSCAGQFVAEHLVGYDGPWLHVDIAGPSTHKERGTGYGVALLLQLFGA